MQIHRLKRLILPTVLAALMTGCASTADTVPSPSPSGMNSASASPGTGGMNTTGGINATDGMNGMNGTDAASPSPGTGTNTGSDTTLGGANGNSAETLTDMEDIQKVSGDVRDAVNKLTEVDEAWVVAVEDYALVGVSYDAQYQSGITDRLRDMVLARAKAADTRISAVYLTDDETRVKDIQALSDSLEGNASAQTVISEADTLRNDLDRTES